MRVLGFVLPSERAILSTPRIQRYVDLRRFQKHEHLRRDLAALRLTPEQIGDLPRCSVPLFDTAEEALGWAYPIERSTLRHGEVLRHFASVAPGEVAHASSYLEYYLERSEAMWRGFGDALAAFESDPEQAQSVIESAKASFRVYRTWQFMQSQRDTIARHRRPFRPA
jgi:heme oxygenase